MSNQSFTSLRMVTQRLATTPATQLPHVATILAGFISDNRRAFALNKNESDTKSGSEVQVTIHKLKTQLSTLLEDKSPHARFSAIILIKATIEVGGWNVLQGAARWVRGMISILGRPDSPASKKLCVLTLTRIFLLTHDHQSLVREITTPSLAPFITAGLNALFPPNTQSSLLLTILQSFCKLIVVHPTSLRPFVPQIRALVFPLIAPTPSNLGGDSISIPFPVEKAAQQLFALLPVCGQRNSAAQEWSKSFDNVVALTQRTANRTFRCFIEAWRPRAETINNDDLAFGDVVSDPYPQPLALPGWTGIYAGIERLNGLLGIIQTLLSCTTSTPVAVPVSDVVSLTNRILSLLQSGSSGSFDTRPEIGRDEHEALDAGLPQLHKSAIGVLSALMARAGSGYMSVLPITMDQVLRILDNEGVNDQVRQASYAFISDAIKHWGLTFPSSSKKVTSSYVKFACTDLLPLGESLVPEALNLSSTSTTLKNGRLSTRSPNSYLQLSSRNIQTTARKTDLQATATSLLQLALTHLPTGYLSPSARAQVDRTAILIGNQELMLASVMNPPLNAKGQHLAASILPLLARNNGGILGVEALLRPQMPMMPTIVGNYPSTEVDEEAKSFEQSRDRLADSLHDNTHSFSQSANSHEAYTTPMSESNVVISNGSGHNLPESGHELPKSFGFLESSKRSRDSDELQNKIAQEGELENAQGGASFEDAPSSKRPRLTSEETEQRQQLIESTKDALVPEKQSSNTFIPQLPLGDLNKENDSADSDESEFELPKLYLDSESDEENSDEEQDGDEENGDEKKG
ncbi:hypothetical protein ACLMJK_009318 [Lecanora helva]